MINFHKRILANGLTVLVEQDKFTALAAVNVLYKVGSRDEDPERTGFAHLFEHLMFSGSKHAPSFDNHLQNVGGENNAYTNTDITNFYDVLPAENIETALWLEADRMVNLKFSERSLKTQKKVVVEEFKEVCLNVPYGDCWHHLSEMAYQEHPYQWPTIGKRPEHITDAVMSDVKAFFRKYYHPANAILSVSSPLPPEEVFSLAEKWFGHIEGPKKVIRHIPAESTHKGRVEKTIYADIPGAMFMMAFHMPDRTSRDYYVCDLISDILANGNSSRFYQRLVRRDKLVSGIDCYITGTADPGLIVIEAKPMPDVKIETVIDLIWAIIDEVKEELVTNRELEKIKNKIIAGLAMSDLNVLNKAISMAYFECLGIIDVMNLQEDIYESITPEEIRNTAQKYLRKEAQILLTYMPE